MKPHPRPTSRVLPACLMPQAQRFVFGMMDDTRSGVVHISAFLNVMQKLQVGRHTNTTTI